jgi:hypothetical protein
MGSISPYENGHHYKVSFKQLETNEIPILLLAKDKTTQFHNMGV